MENAPKLGVMTFRKIRGKCVLLNGQWSRLSLPLPYQFLLPSPSVIGSGVCGCCSQAPARIPAALRAERKDHVTESYMSIG
jgi:hypothetical protein